LPGLPKKGIPHVDTLNSAFRTEKHSSTYNRFVWRIVKEFLEILIARNLRTAAQVPTTNNGRWEVTVSLDQARGHFRLHKP